MTVLAAPSDTPTSSVAQRNRSALLTNAGSLLAARYVVAALGWLGTVIVVRRLSVAEFGRFSFVFSLLGLLAVFTELGLGRIAIKGLMDESHDRAVFGGTLVLLRLSLAAVVYGAALVFVAVAGYPSEVVRATAVGGIVVLLATPSHAIEAVFQVNLRMGTVAVSNVVGQLAQLGLISAIAVGHGTVVLFTVPAVVCEVVILAWRLVTVRPLQPLRLQVDWRQWSELFREAAPLGGGLILASFAQRVDMVMLSKLDTFNAVGIYGVAYKFVDIVHYLPSALMVPVLALLVRAWPDDPVVFAATFRRAFQVLALAAVFVAVEFALFADPVIRMLYGGKYAVGAHAAALVVGAECVGAFGSLAFTALVAMGRPALYPLSALAGLIVNVALNLWLIPTLSYRGAALATAATHLVVVAVLWVPLAKLPALRPLPVRSLVTILVAGALAAGVALLLRATAAWPVAALGAAGAYAWIVSKAGVVRAVLLP